MNNKLKSRPSLITGGRRKESEIRHPTDYYPTPKCSTLSLIESGLLGNTSNDVLLEPCAGTGWVAEVLSPYFKDTIATDKYKYDFNYLFDVKTNIDYLEKSFNKVDWVITNPPYDKKLLQPIINKALEEANKGVCMFLKLTYLESIGRYNFFTNNSHLKYVIVFSNRQPMYKNGENTGASNAIAYAWYIWDKSYVGNPSIHWVNNKDTCNEYLLKKK